MLAVLLVVLALNDRQRESADAPTPAPAPPSAATPPPPPPAPGPAELEQTVRTYYDLLPEDTTTAWEFLGPAERANAGGFSAYVSFWNEIDDVSIRGPVTVQGNTVLATLRFDPQDRGRTLERYQLTMGTAPDGRVLISSAEALGTIKADDNRGGRDNRSGGGRDDDRRSGSDDE